MGSDVVCEFQLAGRASWLVLLKFLKSFALMDEIKRNTQDGWISFKNRGQKYVYCIAIFMLRGLSV